MKFRLCLLLAFVLPLAACGGGGTSTPADGAAVAGIPTPSGVSVVTAQ